MLLPAILLLTCFFSGAQVRHVHQPVTLITFQNPMTPLIILEHFARNNPDAVPYWGMEKRNYTVRYNDPVTSLGHKLVYNRQGIILHSEKEMPLTECPASLVEYYIRNFPDVHLRIWSYENNKGDKKYYFRLHSRIIWFDKEGNYMKREILWN
jgi:hypothetical protein